MKCDVCGSTNVFERLKNPPKPKEHTMTEWSERPKFPSITLEIRYYTYVLECKDCGHTLEYVH